MEELDPRQSTFQWLFQLAFNWNLVRPFVPRILDSTGGRAKTSKTKTGDSSWESERFRQRFVEASVLLAQQLGVSVESLGELFDRVMTTGTRIPVPDNSEAPKGDDASSIHGITLKLHASEGVLLFLVREVGKGHPLALDYPKVNQETPSNFDTVDYWLERGYRLTETRFFSRTLADHVGVGKGEMDVFLSACKTYAKRGSKPVVQSTGTYLGLFGVRPTSSTLDVLVYNFARHQIPAYRLPDVQYPLSPSMKAWIRECSNMSMAEVLNRANDALDRAETSDDSSGSDRSKDDDELFEFQSAMAVAIGSLTTALKPWSNLSELARLSPEILELPSTNLDDEPPAQMVVFEVILPAPEARLSPVQSRASGIQAPMLQSGRADTDKPPAPFIYSPWTLFARSQNMIIRGKLWNEVCKSLHGELARSFPLVPTDLAAEIDAEEKGIPDIPSIETGQRRAQRRERKTVIDVPDSLSEFDEIDEEKALNKALGITSVRATIAPETGLKKGLNTFVARKEGDALRGDRAGPPIYRNVRQKTDGWYLRSMRTLERGEQGSWLNGYDWQADAKS